MSPLHQEYIRELYAASDQNVDILKDVSVAHLIVNDNKVLGAHLIDGLTCEVEELDDGIQVRIVVEEGRVIAKPVQICFGMIPQSGVQKVLMDIDIRPRASVAVSAHCVFPNAVDLKHIMEARIRVAEEANYSYFEKHVHSEQGGILVLPKAVVTLECKARFKTEFELVKGRVGEISIDYETTCGEDSVMEMIARINGRGDDKIRIDEKGYLSGARARGVLTSKIALRENAKAEIYNKLVATAPYARGHVDCKEIVQDNGQALAIPIVEVRHPKAHITHEAAIGSVDNKQLETLMSRGMDEDAAVELIISGLLS